MLPIAYLVMQSLMRRSLAGALATDPVVPKRPRRLRRPTQPAERESFGRSDGRYTTHADEEGQNA